MTATKLLRHETILAALTILALIVLAMLSDKFFTAENLLNQVLSPRGRAELPQPAGVSS